MKSWREWDYPQLFMLYAALLVIWVPGMYFSAMLLMANAHALRDHPDVALPWSASLVPMILAVVVWIVIPGVALFATIRVFLNELRWRRQGDRRAS